jgi:hypothetical protein
MAQAAVSPADMRKTLHNLGGFFSHLKRIFRHRRQATPWFTATAIGFMTTHYSERFLIVNCLE